MFALLMCLVLVMAMPITARADIGPKPSVRIEFTGIEGQKKGKAVGYAFAANTASFAFGLWLAHAIAGIF